MIRRLVPAAMAVLLALAPSTTRAQCSSSLLTSGVPQTVSGNPAYARFAQTTGAYAAVGVRSPDGTNHFLAAYKNSAPSPSCVTNLMAQSAVPQAIQVVVSDCRPGHNPAGTRYAQAARLSGTGNPTFEWEAAAVELFAGQPPDSTRPAPAVLDAWQSFLEGGTTYTLNFERSGAADLKVLVFANPGAGEWSGGRGGAGHLLSITGRTQFTPPSSNDYAMVVVNDNGGEGNYSLWVELCQDPDTLHSTVSTREEYPGRYLFDAVDPYWQVLGVRSDPGANWNLAVYDTGRGSPEPICFGGLLGSSSRTSGVDLVVGDLLNGPLREFYARQTLASGSGGARLEWDAGPDEIPVNGMPILRTTDSLDVLEVWDVFLLSGASYSIQFTPSGTAALRWFLFDNPGQGAGQGIWRGRDQAVLSGTGNAGYTATSESWHGFVVVNENGEPGGYTLTMTSTPAVGVGPGDAPRTALGAISPNPLRGHGTIGYSLAKAARVRIEVIDVAGRRVASLDGGDQPAGPGALSWDGRGERGARLDAGVYFARLFVDEHVVGAARMVLLR